MADNQEMAEQAGDPGALPPIEVPELSALAIIRTLLDVEAEDRWHWRWVCSHATLAQVRQLRPLSPDAGSLVYMPPIPASMVNPHESRWWMVGRPIRIDPDADGLALEDAAAMDSADDLDDTAAKVRTTFGQDGPPLLQGWPWA
jgi:hypothetical protein